MAKEYKLKGASAPLDLAEGGKREFELEGVDGGKVLLVRVNGETHALSANCTHYGAPLKMGVVNAAGRLTCPWHGACFNISTGDVEDAPALDPLARYEIMHKQDGIYVKGEADFVQLNRRPLHIKCTATTEEKVLIIGGGSGTVGAVEGLRGGGFQGHITVLSKEGYRPIDRTKLSKSLMTDISKLAWRSPDFYRDSNIQLIADEATGVDFSAKKVSVRSGQTHVYTKLVLATGGVPRSLPLPGLKQGELQNVFTLRSIPDAENINSALGSKGGKKVVVIGSSFIGMEVANCIAGKKHDVTVVGMEATPLERIMGARVGKIFRGLLEKNGVKFYMSASVEKATASDSDSSRVGAVHLKEGTILPADVVIEGVGVAPATEFLKDSAQLRLEKDGSLSVDEYYAVRGLQDVYAIGDIATYPYHGPGGRDGRPIRVEHWNVAQNAGRAVANTIINPDAKHKPFIPIFWSALGAQLRYCGNTQGGYDDVVFIGDEDKPSFIAYYTSGETVVAVATMAKDPYMTQSAELMRRGKMPTKSEIQKGVDIVQISVPAEIQM